METMIIGSRYKITQILYASEDYCALLGVDIGVRAADETLLNVYEGKYLKRYLGWFDSLRKDGAFIECFIAGESFVTVFRYKKGPRIDEVFYRGAAIDWQTRLYYTKRLLESEIGDGDMPAEIRCASLLSKNIVIKLPDESLWLNYEVVPFEALLGERSGYPERDVIYEREAGYLTLDQLSKILLKRFDQAENEREFLADAKRLVESGKSDSGRLLSLWNEYYGAISEEYVKLYKKGWLQRQLYLCFAAVKRGVRSCFKPKKERPGV